MKYCKKCDTHKPLAEFSKNRRTRDGLDTACKLCVRARGKAWYNAPGNKERNKQRNYAFLAANPGKAAEYSRKWLKKNPEKMARIQHEWYLAHLEHKRNYYRDARVCFPEKYRLKECVNDLKNKPARLAKGKRWRGINGHVISAHAAKRRASRIQRTPMWLTPAQRAEIAEFYLIAKLLTEITGVLQHVDHIVPLRGKAVSGLHVPWNLQVIPATENLQKHNKWAAS